MKIYEFCKKNRFEKIYLFKKKFCPNKISSLNYLSYLRSIGMKIGKGTILFDPTKTIIDSQRPWMIEIGEFCKITTGVVILSHDYSRSVLRRRYNEILCECKKTFIGNNVFIGINSILLMGTKLGNNVIVGAGSVVSGEFPDDVVIGGNPAKIICSLEKYYEKRKNNQIKEAKIWVNEFTKLYSRIPQPNEMSAFFPLFLKRDLSELKNKKIWTSWSGDVESEIYESFMNSHPVYESYEDFLRDAMNDVERGEKL